MALICLECEKPAFKVIASAELGPDHRSDERSLQVLGCGSCGFRAVGLYEESRRGASDSFHHSGYRAPRGVVDALERALADHAVPDPAPYITDNGGKAYPSFPVMFTSTRE